MRRLPLRSPPRMRGKAKNRCRSCPLTRITPACAGKRWSSKHIVDMLWDHPRVCGEKNVLRLMWICGMGSPPRMRGKVQVGDTGGDAGGITPAYAGKRLITTMMRNQLRDHPRVCGEKVLNTFIMVCHVGSPPRMQGKGDSPPFFWTDSRITPAYAGKSDSIATRLS